MPPAIDTLRWWSQFLLWVTIVAPIIAAAAAGARYYVERYEKRLSSEAATAQVKQAQDDASRARAEAADALAKQDKADAAARQKAEDDRRAAEALAAFKRTPPQVSAHLARFPEGDQLAVVLTAANLVPFSALWSISTEKRLDVGGIMLEEIVFHPTEDKRTLNVRVNINPKKVVNEYLELDVRYTSIYFAELGSPKELRVEESSRYRFKDGNIYPWDFDIGQGKATRQKDD